MLVRRDDIEFIKQTAKDYDIALEDVEAIFKSSKCCDEFYNELETYNLNHFWA